MLDVTEKNSLAIFLGEGVGRPHGPVPHSSIQVATCCIKCAVSELLNGICLELGLTKVVSDSPRLVDLHLGQVDFGGHLLTGKSD